MLAWRIYYDSGETYSDVDGSPSSAPGQGVLAIAQANPLTGHDVLHLADYYLYKGGKWIGLDLFGLLDHVLNCFDEIHGVVAGRGYTS